MSKNTACAALKAPIEQALKVAINNRDLAKAALSAIVNATKAHVDRTVAAQINEEKARANIEDYTLEDVQRAFDAAIAKVKKLRHELDNVCSYRKCEPGIYSLVG